MSNIIIISVHNNRSFDIQLPVPGYADRHEPVIVPASGDLNLNGPLTEDECMAMQPLLNLLVADGSLTSTGTVNTEFLDWND